MKTRNWLVFFCGAGLAGTGMVGEEQADQGPGTRSMATRLEMLIEQAGLSNPNANLGRAEALRTRMAGVEDAAEVFDLRLRLAVELLNGGASEAALREFIGVRDFLVRNRLLSGDNKEAMHQRIALCYLRIGEQENCLEHHSAESCLLPIEGAGIHRLERGSRGAIRELSSLLEERPGNLGARWLLNIAYMTVGEYPGKVPAEWRIDPKVFESEHQVPRFTDVAGPAGVAVDDTAGGSITEDFDGDGLLDIMCSAMRWRAPVRYFRSKGDGTFDERTKEAGLTGETGGLNLMQADYNNDGSPDVLVLRGGWEEELGRQPLSLLRNRGEGTFEDVTEAAGLLRFHPTQTAVWLDYDSDGWLDLFVGNETMGKERHPCELFRNRGDGTFVECGVASGAAIYGFVKGVASGDFNNDGRPDIYLSRLGQANVLLRKEGPDGAGEGRVWKFTDVTEAAGVGEPVDSFPTWFFDYDNDGWEDLFVSGYFLDDVGAVAADYLGLPHRGARVRLYRNMRDGRFEDVTREAGLHRVLLSMGANYGDLDNDGWLDLYVGTGDPNFDSLMPNRMFRNGEGKRFEDVTSSGGFGHLQKGHGISFADLDNDGDQDIYEVMGGRFSGDNYRNVLFENPGSGNHWVTLKLEGVKATRSAVGARIKLLVRSGAGLREIHKTVGTGGSFGASPLRQEIGLGRAEAIEQLEIRWPVSGLRQRFEGLEMDRFYKIREGVTTIDRAEPRRFSFRRGAGQHQHHDDSKP